MADPKREDAGKPVDVSLLQRMAEGLRYMATGKVPEWFGPGEVMKPMAQQSAGRRFDYGFNVNANVTPKFNEGVTFEQLRALADLFEPLRLVIEARKDQLAKQKWTIKYKDPKRKPDARIDELIELFSMPDGQNGWDEWLRMILEDMLVIDAACVVPRKLLDGTIFAFEPVDGATIKVIIDQNGRRPALPNPAYQQNIKGMAASNFTADELVYRPRNLRSNRLYGFSPVEQVVTTAQTGLRRALSQLNYFTDGTVPDAIMGVPDEWNVDQVKEWQEYFDIMMRGNDKERRAVRFVYAKMAETFKEVKLPPLKDQFDEWLMRIVAYAFSIDVTPFVAQVNRATAETNREQSLSEGLVPLQKWVKGFIDYLLLKYLDGRDIEFAWVEEDSVKPLDQANIHKTYVDAGVLTEDEVREDLGRDPFTEEQLAGIAEKKAAAMPQQLGPDGKPVEQELDKDGKPVPPKKGEPSGAKPPGKEDEEAKPKKEEEDTKKIEVHVHNHVAQPDVFVEVGPTTINATMGGQTETAVVEKE